MELDNYTPKQIEVLESFAIDNPKILICREQEKLLY